MVLLEDHSEDAVLLWEARRHIVKDVRKLHNKVVRRVQDLALHANASACAAAAPSTPKLQGHSACAIPLDNFVNIKQVMETFTSSAAGNGCSTPKASMAAITRQ